MDMTQASCREFLDALSSSEPTPGGGGAAALVGAIGAALGSMVINLTCGKAKYAAHQPELESLARQLEALRQELADQVEADEAGFLPLAQAYGIPRSDPKRQQALQQASIRACDAPMNILRLCARTLTALERAAQIGSPLAISDAGCGALCCRSAMEAAALNVRINTRTMSPCPEKEDLEGETDRLLETFCPLAQRIYQQVLERLR